MLLVPKTSRAMMGLCCCVVSKLLFDLMFRCTFHAGRASSGPHGHAAPGGGGRNGDGPTWVSRGGSLATGPVRGEANDYSQHFVDTGLRPQNNLRDVHLVRPRPGS